MESEEGGRLQYNGNAQKPGRTYEERTQSGNDAIHRMKVGSALTAPIQDHNLVFHEQGFCDYCTRTARAHQSHDSDYQVDKQGGQITHYATIVSIEATMTRLGFSTDLCGKIGIRHTQVGRMLQMFRAARIEID